MATAPISSTSTSTSTSSSATADASANTSTPAATDKQRFSAVLARAASEKAEAEKEAANVKSRQKSPTLNQPSLSLISYAMPNDARAWTLSLPKEEQAAVTGKSAGTGTDAADPNETTAHAKNMGALHEGEVAFTANFNKVASLQVPHSQGTISAKSVGATWSEAGAAGTVSQESGAGQNKNSGRDQHGESDTPQGQSAPPAAAANPSTPTPISTASATPAVANLAPTSQVVSAYGAAPAAKATPAQPAAPTAPPEPDPAPTGKPQNIDFRVPGADDRDVNVRVSQRAGDVQVTVRTGDTDLAQTLRQHLPELSDRLAQTGVHADLWRPSAPGGSSSEANANSARDDGQIYGRDAGGNAYGANSSNEQQNDQQNAQQAAWMNQLFGAEKEA